MLIETTTLLAFALASMAVYLAPGVDTVFIATNSISHGWRAGAWAALGTTTGVTFQATAAAFGVTAIFSATPILFEILRWAGVAYLLYLGVKILRSRDAFELSTGDRRWTRRDVYFRALAINLLNPKISLFFLAFLPQFVNPAAGHVFAQLLTLGLLFSAGGILWCLFQAAMFARIGNWINRSALARAWQRRITGGALIGFAGMLAISGIRR